MSPLRADEGVAFRDFTKKISRPRLEELLRAGRPEPLSVEDVLKNGADAIARLAAMHAGYDAALIQFFSLVETKPSPTSPSDFADMT